MKNILVLQHETHEGLGAFEPLFKSGGRTLTICNLALGNTVPSSEELCAFDGVVILGGPMSANDGGKIPFIQDEIDRVKDILSLKLPLLGVCLGAQIIAKALGGKVTKGPQKEIGWYPLQLTLSSNKDVIFGGLSSPAILFQWHGETFELPSGAIKLASSTLYSNQAFRYTDRIYGLQFHCEMTDFMIRDWIEKGKQEIEDAGLSAEMILEMMPKYLPTLRHWAHQIANKWLALK